MSDYLPSFIVEPVLRQARRFSSRTPHSHPHSAGDLPESEPLPSLTPQAGYFPGVPDFQRFYPTRFWNTSTPPPTGRDETTEGTWQSLARNIQLWANQINNLDVIPSPPLDPMVDNAVAEGDEGLAFPPLDTSHAPVERPIRLEEHRTNSETSLNPAQELSYRSRAFAETNRGHSQSDPLSHPGNDQPASRTEPQPAMPVDDGYRRRDGSGQLPEDDGMSAMRQRINVVMAGPGTAAEKSKLIQILMSEKYRNAHSPPPSRGRSRPHNGEGPTAPRSAVPTNFAQPVFQLTRSELAPSYAPLDMDEDGVIVQTHPDLGCEHYKRNVKMQCATCEKWYTCRLCHDEVEDHTLPRRETRHMLCMLCRTPQGVSQECKNCLAEAACYYCAICKLWNNDPNKSVYHCDDCGICRLGKGLGKDFFHCKTCAACMSIQAETTHKCIEKSTKCDCPICGDYMFTSNRPVAFMKCGHGIHEICFNEWCKTSYKCPICSKSIANMESQFRRLDRHIEDQPMPEEYRNNRAYIFCNDCNSRSIAAYHWLGLKCSICESYNTTQLELLGPEQTPEQIREQNERAQQIGEAGLTASQTHTPANELTTPAMEIPPVRQDSIPVARPHSPRSPHLLPHSPTRSARSVTPVVGSYFGPRMEPDRRNSFFSIFSAGQPMTPQSSRTEESRTEEVNDEDLDFWGRHSPRSQDADMEDAEASEESSSSDEEMTAEDDDDTEDDRMQLPGHR